MFTNTNQQFIIALHHKCTVEPRQLKLRANSNKMWFPKDFPLFFLLISNQLSWTWLIHTNLTFSKLTFNLVTYT